MKKLIIIALTLMFFSINAQNTKSTAKDKADEQALKPEKNDDGEYDLIVIDTQFDYFLNAVAKPKSQYTESYLKNRNTFLVSEWNSYFTSGRYRNIIESRIDYDPQEKYGLNFEYKLYQVFAYVNWRYQLRMSGLSGSDATRF